MDAGEDGPGVDDVAHVAGPDGIQYLLAAFAGLVPDPCADAVFPEHFPGQGGGFDIKTHVVEAPDQGDGFFLVFVCHADHDGAVIFQRQARGDQGLKDGPVQLVVVADGFAGGFHFR